MTPHFRVAAARARALHAAATGTARLIVASAAALLPRVSPPERLLRASLAIRSGTEIEPQDLADLLVDAGFTREDPVDEHGVVHDSRRHRRRLSGRRRRAGPHRVRRRHGRVAAPLRSGDAAVDRRRPTRF